MSYYELPAEGRGYYLFEHRRLNDGAAHFHSALEFVFVEPHSESGGSMFFRGLPRACLSRYSG